LVLKDSFPVKGTVNCFYETVDSGYLYFGTSNGIFRFDRNDLHARPLVYTTQQGLPSNYISAFESKKKGELWISTTSGLAYYHEGRDTFSSFSLADGMQSIEFHTTASFVNRNGEICFGGSDGITIVPVETIDSIRYVTQYPSLSITSVLANSGPLSEFYDLSGRENVCELNEIRLPYKANTVSLQFAAHEFSDPSDMWFQYALSKSGDVKYGPLTKSNEVTFYDQPEGGYTFYLKATNSDGIFAPSGEPLSFKIKIDPPFWRQWWFRALELLLFLAIVYGYYRFRMEQVRKKQEALRKEALFKQKEAEYKQLVAETETAVLRLQMNPHFIFNSLNSISSYILDKNVDTANEYLGRFAQLMRTILKLAANPTITVSDEMELLGQYMDIEAMRFEGRFDYSFTLSDNLDPYEYQLPTMILQPFVENSILHGLAHKKGHGHIAIKFSLENDSLVCVVEDNGIGRVASESLKYKMGTQHESKALAITQKRLKLLGEEYDKKASCKIVDLVGEGNVGAGTMVVLELPIL